jgi:hypothetical protein
MSVRLKPNLHSNRRASDYATILSNAAAKPASYTVTLSGLQEIHS